MSRFLSRHELTFIPEIRLGDRVAISAWKRAPVSPRTAAINFCQPMVRHLDQDRIHALRRQLGDLDALILMAVGRDELLDRLTVDEYHRMAIQMNANIVVSPDDYIYDSDGKYPFYQDSHFSRAITRALELVQLGRGHYDLVGLAVGSDQSQLREFVTVMGEQGVSDFAFACGDLLKQGRNRRKTLNEIESFVDYLRRHGHVSMLLGIDSSRFIKRLRPDYYSSSQWSIDASHGRYYARDGSPRKGSSIGCNHSICNSGELSGTERLAVHNILMKHELLSIRSDL